MAPITRTDIKVRAAPDTDLWRKPPATDVSTAPSTTVATGALSAFTSARATLHATFVDLYDQGGLVLKLSNPSFSKVKWVKCGVENVEAGKPRVSVVGCDAWADWSLHPISGKPDGVTLQVERIGHGLWVYEMVGGEKVALREIVWIGDGLEETSVEVGVYAARPKGKGLGELEVTFEDVIVDLTSD